MLLEHDVERRQALHHYRHGLLNRGAQAVKNFRRSGVFRDLRHGRQSCAPSTPTSIFCKVAISAGFYRRITAPREPPIQAVGVWPTAPIPSTCKEYGSGK